MMRVLVRDGVLDESEHHHLRVRRAEPGEAVELRDGRGLVGYGRLRLTGKVWSVDVDSVQTVPSPPALVVGVGAGDRDRFGWLVEKAAELGATVVVPLETARTAGVASKLRDAHIERLRQRAFEAVKQCGGAWAPVVEVPVSLAEFAARPEAGVRWLADPSGAAPPAELDERPVVVAVGPEGGFTDEERHHLMTQGFVPAALGPYTLRFETAAVAAIAAVAVARQRGHHGGLSLL